MSRLPTVDEILELAEATLHRALVTVRDAEDVLRSDWSPVGSSLTDAQLRRRVKLAEAMAHAAAAIESGWVGP